MNPIKFAQYYGISITAIVVIASFFYFPLWLIGIEASYLIVIITCATIEANRLEKLAKEEELAVYDVARLKDGKIRKN